MAAPPKKVHELAEWFAEGVQEELSELERNGSEKIYELHSGQRFSSGQSPYIVYRFTLADGSLVPEDASAMLEVENQQFRATVVAQESNRIDIQVEEVGTLGKFISRALLRVDDLGLLRKMKEILDSISSGDEKGSALMVRIFHPKSDGKLKTSLPRMPELDQLSDEQRAVLEQACASQITFVWGPPGTGKTYVIAHLIATLVKLGERVLMSSHTHAAVDQSIYETVKMDSNGTGPLAKSDLVKEGKIVRVGRVTNNKVPESVCLDRIVENRTRGIQSEIKDLQNKATPLSQKRTKLNEDIYKWKHLGKLKEREAEADEKAKKAVMTANSKASELTQVGKIVEERKVQINQASKSWFFRAKRIEKARKRLSFAQRSLEKASKIAAESAAKVEFLKGDLESLRLEVQNQTEICDMLPPLESQKQRLLSIERELQQIDQRIAELRSQMEALVKKIIAEAKLVAATLTKCYVGDQLIGQDFDALIVDEISMALPPLLFIAGRLATRRIILVGDFKQLPPIVRSDNEVSNMRLSRDAFHLSGIAKHLEPTSHPALVQLRIQRRMLPAIADAARHISYRQKDLHDHPILLGRKQPPWLSFLPKNALNIVDFADLHTWSGRQAGSLSRFNLYSAQIAVELAAMAAAEILRPKPTDIRKIGIITPYAAQRRLLGRLIKALDLVDWVEVGTIHTFQGGEGELIIFDTVLDNPFWTARLCNPNKVEDVKRDLNVAVTRAKSKFVLLGSSEWLNKNAKPASGLGQLWQYFKDNADLISAADLVETGFESRVVEGLGTYDIPFGAEYPAHEILDEGTFFDAFAIDVENAQESFFGLVPFFGEYRWPKVEPLLRNALKRGVEITLVTPPPSEAQNASYVNEVIRSLRKMGAVIVPSMGLHGEFKLGQSSWKGRNNA